MTGLPVTVSGSLHGEEVSATRHPDGRVEGDTDLLLLVGKLAEKGVRVSYWPYGGAEASTDDDRAFAITCASQIEGPRIEGLDEEPDDPGDGLTVY